MTETALTSAHRDILSDLGNRRPGGITQLVIDDMLDQEEPITWLKTLLSHGCASGNVTNLISYRETHEFFDHHYDEIEEIREEYDGILGHPLQIDGDLKNWLAWFAYEKTAQQLADKLGIENYQQHEIIAHANDTFRQSLDPTMGIFALTPSISALDSLDQQKLIHLVQSFNIFTEDNDHHQEHDFGRIDFGDVRYFWKIDLYDRETKSVYTPDPTNPNLTWRVLTVMEASEY